jgi:hypothetical protein
MEPGGADAAGASSQTYLLERFMPAGSLAELEGFVSRARAATAAPSEHAVRVSPLWSVYVPAEELCLCVVQAPSREAVERAAARSGVTFERIIEVVALGVRERGKRERT